MHVPVRFAARTHIFQNWFCWQVATQLGPDAATLAAVAGGWLSTTNMLIGLIIFEAVAGGLLTTLMFTVMMASVDREIGASHYTALATAGKPVRSQARKRERSLSDAKRSCCSLCCLCVMTHRNESQR